VHGLETPKHGSVSKRLAAIGAVWQYIAVEVESVRAHPAFGLSGNSRVLDVSIARLLEIVTTSVLVLTSTSPATDRSPPPVRLDSAQVSAMVPDSSGWGKRPRTSDWSSLAIPGDSSILFADGTEWARVPTPPARVDAATDAGSRYAPLWNRFREGCFPRHGIALELDGDQGRGPQGSTYSQGSVDLLIQPGITRWASLEFGFGWEHEYSHPARTLFENESSLSSGIRGVVGVCGPVVCLELVRHPLPFGPQIWLQPGMDTLARSRSAGEFWNSMATQDFSGVWERRIRVRAGSVRYELAECPGLWNGFYQELGLGDLPAGPLRFGAYLDWTRSRGAVRAELGFAPIRLRRNSEIELAPFLVSLAFRQMGEMQISVRSRIDFPDPFPSLVRRWHP